MALDTIDDVVRRRRAGRDAHALGREEPLRKKIRLRLDVMNVRTVLAARVDELARVVALRAADHDDDITTARQLDGGGLAVLRGTTDGVEETDVGLRELLSNERNQASHLVDRLRRLGSNAHARTALQRQHVAFVEHDVELVEIFRQSPHLDMSALADDDRVVAVADEGLDRPMRHLHERAGGLDDLQAERAGVGQRPFGSPMRSHHHGLRCHARRLIGGRNPPGP